MPSRQQQPARALVRAQDGQQQRTAPQQALIVVAHEIDQRMAIIEASAAAGITADRLKQVALAVFTRTPALLECEPVSLARAIVEAGQLGLEPTGLLGGAYLVPRGKQATLMIGYRGLVMLAKRSGEVARVEARVVRSKDRFEYSYGLDSTLVHVPAGDADPGPYTHAYAVIHYRDGGRQFDVMTLAEIEAVRKRSSAATSGPWVTDWPEMAKKTVLRRAMKLAPLTVQVAAKLDELDPELGPDAPAQARREPATSALRQQLQQALEQEYGPTVEGQAREVPTTDGAGGGTQGQPDAEGAVEERAPSAPAEPAQAEPAPSEAAPAPACGAVSRKLGAGPCVKPAGHREAEHEEAGGTRFTTGRDEQ